MGVAVLFGQKAAAYAACSGTDICYSEVIIDEFECIPDSLDGCKHQRKYANVNQPCPMPATCQTVAVCSSDDAGKCAATRDIYGKRLSCDYQGGCTNTSCCGPGAPGPTNTPGGGPTNTPAAPTNTPPAGTVSVSGTVYERFNDTDNSCDPIAGDVGKNVVHGANPALTIYQGATLPDRVGVNPDGSFTIPNVPINAAGVRWITIENVDTSMYDIIKCAYYDAATPAQQIPNVNTNPSNPPLTTLTANITGADFFVRAKKLPTTVIVYEDSDNTCTSNTAPTAGFSGTVSFSDTIYTAPPNVNLTSASNFTTQNLQITSPWVVSMSGLAPGWQISDFCDTDSKLVVPGSTVYFYVKKSVVDAWWQAGGAGVLANNGNVTSMIPTSLVGEALIKPIPGALALQGALNLNSHLVSNPNPPYTYNWQVGMNSPYDVLTTNREDFTSLTDLLRSKVAIDDNLDPANYNNLPIPTGAPGTYYYYLVEDDGTDATVNLGTVWSVAANQKITVIVQGDLNIQNTITVANGGFLAFIVKGNINIAPNVTSVQGVYVADGIINTGHVVAGNDSQLKGQGMFVGWGGVNLQRDLGNVGAIINGNTPAELFTYRPDLLLNAPPEFRDSTYDWSEIAP